MLKNSTKVRNLFYTTKCFLKYFEVGFSLIYGSSTRYTSNTQPILLWGRMDSNHSPKGTTPLPALPTELTPPNDNHKQSQSSGGVIHLLIAYGYLLSVIATSLSGICCYWYLLLPHGSLVGEPISLDYKGMYFISIYQIFFTI